MRFFSTPKPETIWRATEAFLLVGLLVLAIFSYWYFSRDASHLLYGDALSRMNISRKMADNLTPGFAQVGNVWLPLPQLLMFPLTLNEYVWHSGMAGGLMSGFFFFIGGYFIFKSARLLTGSAFGSLAGTAIYALNINALYLQTTAMSEMAFVGLAAGLTYCLIQWTKYHKLGYLILSAIVLTLVTLTRYEGLALLVAATLLVFWYSILTKQHYKKSEGHTILFLTLAGLGFGLWTLYLSAVFGDPLYWKNYYISPVVVNTAVDTKKYLQNLSPVMAMWKYLTAVIWMNGLIPVILAGIGSVIALYRAIAKKAPYHITIFIHLAIYAFVAFTLTRNTPINQPDLTLTSLLSPATNQTLEFNLRYGILLLPLIAIVAAYVFSVKSLVLRIVLLELFMVQIAMYYYPVATIIYQLPLTIRNNITQSQPRERAMVTWLKANYDGGLILISAARHDPKMFDLGIDYRNFIHEGTQDFWLDSLAYPAKYAKWVVFDYYDQGSGYDVVYAALRDSSVWSERYDLVYNRDGMQVYKIKTQPDNLVTHR